MDLQAGGRLKPWRLRAFKGIDSAMNRGESVLKRRDGWLFGYGTHMESQSSSIDAIRDRISLIQEKELDLHVGEYDDIHQQLERALGAIDGL